MKGFFELLEKKQRPTHWEHGEEMRFFLANNVFLQDYPTFRRLRKASSPFAVMRANIIIRAIISKKTIESAIMGVVNGVLSGELAKAKAKEAVESALENLPHFTDGAKEIYIPFIEKNINHIVVNEPERLLDKRYQNLLRHADIISIDPFDEYGPSIFASMFSPLELLCQNEDSCAYFDRASESIFIVNKQGRLDCRIALFDRYLANPSMDDIEVRTRAALDYFYRFDFDNMVKSMVENRLISSSLLGDNNTDVKPIIIDNRI